MPDEAPLFFQPPPRPRKGRGALTQLAHRFERDVREVVDDGWQSP